MVFIGGQETETTHTQQVSSLFRIRSLSNDSDRRNSNS